jgi:hypothetical protein
LRTNSKLAIIEFTIKEISDILKSLNIKKAYGHDLISHHMLKNTANTVSIPLKIIFDYSIQTSTFPDHWKLAKVMSLFKNGNKSLVSNYRSNAFDISLKTEQINSFLSRDIHIL